MTPSDAERQADGVVENFEQVIRADERRTFADYLDRRATEFAVLPDQHHDLRLMQEIYRDVANQIRFNETAGGNDGHPISRAAPLTERIPPGVPGRYDRAPRESIEVPPLLPGALTAVALILALLIVAAILR